MSPSILKLNETNYAEWSMLMEAVLVRKGLWGVASGADTKPLGSPNTKTVKSWKRKSDEARTEIILNVEPSQLPHIKSMDAPDVWEDLKMLHQARGFGTRLSRRRAFFQMAMRPDQSMSSWVGDVRRAAFQLTEIGVNLTDEDCIVVLMGGLPSSYEQCVVTLDSTPDESLTFDYVVNRLLNEESRKNPIMSPTLAGNEPALVAAAARPHVPLSMITCYRCAQKGHYQANCPLAPVAPVAPAGTAALADMEEYAF